MQPLIVGFGEALIDKLPSGDVVGGAPLNFSLRTAELGEHLGCDAAIVTRIGNDEFGRLISARLLQSNLELSGVQIEEVLPSGFVDVVLRDGQPDYKIGRQVAWEAIEFDEAAVRLAARAAVVCFGTLVQLGELSARTLGRFLESASSAINILDINLRKPLPDLETLQFSLQMAHVLKCNVEELEQLAQWLSLEHPTNSIDVAKQLQERFKLQSVFWTRSAEGCCLQIGANCVTGEVPKFTPQPNADSVGAGDSASAALAIGLVLGWQPEQIVRVANLCGAFAASQHGATTPLTRDVIAQI